MVQESARALGEILKQLATNNPVYTHMTTFAGLQQIPYIVNSSKKKAADSKTREKQRVTPHNLPVRQRVGPHVIEDDTPELTYMIQNKGRKDARTENLNVVQDRTFNQPVERHAHRYPTRNLIQTVQTMGLELLDKMQGALIGQPEENPETTMTHTDMPPFLINAIIDDEIDLQALIHGVETLENQVNSVTCPKTGKELEFRHLIADPVTKKLWDPAMSTEIDRLIDKITIYFIKREKIPTNEKAVYTRLVADLRPNKAVHERLRICMGGDQITSVMDTTTSTAELTTCKIHLNGVVSTKGGRFAASDVKDIYLGTPFKDKRYARELQRRSLMNHCHNVIIWNISGINPSLLRAKVSIITTNIFQVVVDTQKYR